MSWFTNTISVIWTSISVASYFILLWKAEWMTHFWYFNCSIRGLLIVREVPVSKNVAIALAKSSCWATWAQGLAVSWADPILMSDGYSMRDAIVVVASPRFVCFLAFWAICLYTYSMLVFTSLATKFLLLKFVFKY